MRKLTHGQMVATLKAIEAELSGMARDGPFRDSLIKAKEKLEEGLVKLNAHRQEERKRKEEHYAKTNADVSNCNDVTSSRFLDR